MAQPIILNANQVRILYKLGKRYGSGLSFANVRISPTAGALCDWAAATETWNKLDTAQKIGCLDLEVDRKDLIAFLDWFDKDEKDAIELRSQFGTIHLRTDSEKALLTYLKLAQAFNYPQDIKKNDE